MRIDSVATVDKAVSIRSLNSTKKKQKTLVVIWKHTERQLLVNVSADDVGVDNEAVGHVVEGQEDGVG